VEGVVGIPLFEDFKPHFGQIQSLVLVEFFTTHSMFDYVLFRFDNVSFGFTFLHIYPINPQKYEKELTK
jgi:hypothetical protein